MAISHLRITILAIAIASIIFISGCTGNAPSDISNSASLGDGSSATAILANTSAGTPSNASGPSTGSTTSSTTGKEIAVFETSKGNIEIELHRADAPITVENFVTYVKSGFYDGTIFHRVIAGFMIQGGGFNEAGEEKMTRAPIKLESGNRLHNGIGTISMARTSAPDSATAQFFINTADNGFLDRSASSDGYAVFGKVVSGMDVVSKIESADTASHGAYDDWPVEKIVIKRAYMK